MYLTHIPSFRNMLPIRFRGTFGTFIDLRLDTIAIVMTVVEWKRFVNALIIQNLVVKSFPQSSGVNCYKRKSIVELNIIERGGLDNYTPEDI